MTLADQLGAILTEARGDRSRRDLAGALGLSNTTLISLEQGKANPTLDRVERMADAYGVDLVLRAVPRTGGARGHDRRGSTVPGAGTPDRTAQAYAETEPGA